jgi:hypothetical protein
MKIKLEDSQPRKIRRTICIGLGGTGKDVLMRIRRLIVDKYGSLNNLPIASFVHIVIAFKHQLLASKNKCKLSLK